METNLRNLCEQIQEGIRTYADSGLITLSEENLDDLCEIVVQSFREFKPGEEFSSKQERKSFLITEIEFDVSGECHEIELQENLQKWWRGTITPPVIEEELADYISDRSGWCVRNLEYSTLTPAN